ncbi:hypothetical protein, conserved [Plasmodium gonderi]|uniref:Mechanosensitive ion channel MscS domain-containing protein n=1 Tax=Plasmodium gonderi TaxID=77519 RepID=A0A1Y1JI36_PLAGO|nr:hypothetical protein, conserved [Plasmodium gonderi]GAW80857.1 hypothetical protein, conserved [Plasmodium gonderi]
MNELREENYKSGSKAKYPHSLMMDMSRSYMNRQDRINALNLYIQKSSYNPQFLQDDEEEEDESESETLWDIILRILSIIFPDLSPGLWFIIHFTMNLVVLCVSLSSLSEPNLHDPVHEPKYNRSFIYGSIYCCFLILGINMVSFTIIMIIHAIIQKLFLERLLQPSALCAAFYNTVDPELVYLLWSSVQIIYWRSNMILKKGEQENGDYYVLRIFGYKDKDNPLMFLKSINWLISFPILLYIVFAARLLLLSIISFVFELGFLMNAHDLLGKYLSQYGILRKFNIEWFMFVADKQENIRSLFGYELYQDEKMIRQLETNDISKKIIQDKAELLLFKNLPRNCTCCKITLNRNKKRNAMKLLVPPIFESKNIVKTETSTIKNWLACHYVVNTPPLIFLLNNSIPLINKNSIKIGGDILFRQIIMSLKMYYQEKNDTYAFTGSAMHNISSDDFSHNKNLQTLNLNRDSNLRNLQETFPNPHKNPAYNSDSESRAKKKINLENIFNDIDLDAIRSEAAEEKKVKERDKLGKRREENEVNLLNRPRSRDKNGYNIKKDSKNENVSSGGEVPRREVVDGEVAKRDVTDRTHDRQLRTEEAMRKSETKQREIKNTQSSITDKVTEIVGEKGDNGAVTIFRKKNEKKKSSIVGDMKGRDPNGMTSIRDTKKMEEKTKEKKKRGKTNVHDLSASPIQGGDPNGFTPTPGLGLHQIRDPKMVDIEAKRNTTQYDEYEENGNESRKKEIHSNQRKQKRNNEIGMKETNLKEERDRNGANANVVIKETSILEDTKFNIFITPSVSGIKEVAIKKKEGMEEIKENGNANREGHANDILYDDNPLKDTEERTFFPPLENYNSMKVQIKDLTIEEVLKKKYSVDSVHKKEMKDSTSNEEEMIENNIDKEVMYYDIEMGKTEKLLKKEENNFGTSLKNIGENGNTLNMSSEESNIESHMKEINSSYQIFGDRKKKTNKKAKDSGKFSKKIKNNISGMRKTYYYHSHLLNEENNILERSDAMNVKRLKENKKVKLSKCFCFKKNKKGRFSKIKKDMSLEIDDLFVMNVRSPIQMSINGNEFITKEMIEVFLKPEETEEFMKEFDLSGHGKIDMIMFRNAIKRAISCRKKFIKSLKGQESILKLVRRLMSILLSFLATVVLLFIFGVSVDTIIVTGAAFITAVTVILSYMYTNFITSVIFIAFSNPYNIGDRVRLDGGEAMYIKKIKTYTTEFETTTGKIVIYENSKLSNVKIYNESRSKNAYIDISFKVDINTPLLALKELRKSLQFLVDNRPSDFCKTKNLYFGCSLQPGHFYEISFWIKCVEGWGNWRKVFELRTDVYDFIILQLRLLSISYRLPTQKVGFTAPLNIMDTSNLKLNRNNKPHDYSYPPKDGRNPLFMHSAKHKRELDPMYYGNSYSDVNQSDEKQRGNGHSDVNQSDEEYPGVPGNAVQRKHMENLLQKNHDSLSIYRIKKNCSFVKGPTNDFCSANRFGHSQIQRRKNSNKMRYKIEYRNNREAFHEHNSTLSTRLQLPRGRNIIEDNFFLYRDNYHPDAVNGSARGVDAFGVDSSNAPFSMNSKMVNREMAMNYSPNSLDKEMDNYENVNHYECMNNYNDLNNYENVNRYKCMNNYEEMHNCQKLPLEDVNRMHIQTKNNFMYEHYGRECFNDMVNSYNIFHNPEQSNEMKYSDEDELSYGSSSGYDSFEYVKHFTKLHNGVRKLTTIKNGRNGVSNIVHSKKNK